MIAQIRIFFGAGGSSILISENIGQAVISGVIGIVMNYLIERLKISREKKKEMDNYKGKL